MYLSVYYSKCNYISLIGNRETNSILTSLSCCGKCIILPSFWESHRGNIKVGHNYYTCNCCSYVQFMLTQETSKNTQQNLSQNPLLVKHELFVFCTECFPLYIIHEFCLYCLGLLLVVSFISAFTIQLRQNSQGRFEIVQPVSWIFDSSILTKDNRKIHVNFKFV